MYEEKKKRFFPPLTHLYLTQTSPPPHTPSLRSPFTEQFQFSIQNPRLTSTLPALPFVNVFILKRNLTLCTYPPCGIRVSWGFVEGVRGSGESGGWALYLPPSLPASSPPSPFHNLHFTLLTGVLSPFCFIILGRFGERLRGRGLGRGREKRGWG